MAISLPPLRTAALRRLLAGFAFLLATVLANAEGERAMDGHARPSTESPLIREWRSMSASITGLSERAKVWQVNAFFNQKIRYEEDIVLWGQDDYWATPLETLSQGRGDCEDYAIAKYFTLLELGIPSARMRLVYVVLVTRGRDINDSRRHSHMVVAYFPRPASEPWILDNLNDDILPADLAHVMRAVAGGLEVHDSDAGKRRRQLAGSGTFGKSGDGRPAGPARAEPYHEFRFCSATDRLRM